MGRKHDKKDKHGEMDTLWIQCTYTHLMLLMSHHPDHWSQHFWFLKWFFSVFFFSLKKKKKTSCFLHPPWFLLTLDLGGDISCIFFKLSEGLPKRSLIYKYHVPNFYRHRDRRLQTQRSERWQLRLPTNPSLCFCYAGLCKPIDWLCMPDYGNNKTSMQGGVSVCTEWFSETQHLIT